MLIKFHSRYPSNYYTYELWCSSTDTQPIALNVQRKYLGNVANGCNKTRNRPFAAILFFIVKTFKRTIGTVSLIGIKSDRLGFYEI